MKNISLKILLVMVVFFNTILLQGQSAPKANFSPIASCKQVYTNNSSYAGRERYRLINYTINYGDGSSSTFIDGHTYTNNGTYSICLTMNYFDSLTTTNKSDSICKNIVINCTDFCDNFVSKFTSNTLDSQDCKKIEFRHTYYNKYNGTIKTYMDFGNGTFDSSFYNGYTKTYSTKGVYLAKLITLYTDDSKTLTCRDTFIDSVYADCNLCKKFNAKFSILLDQDDCKKVYLYNYSNPSATSYLWNFGNGDTSSSKSASFSYKYSNDGVYKIKLTASNANCSSVFEQNIQLDCNPCLKLKADIYLVTDSMNGSKAQLYNYSRGAIGGHYWNFGDGTTSTAKAPIHTYTSPGKIKLTYVVSDTGTCKDTAYIDFTIDSSGNIKRGNVSFSLQVVDRTINTAITNIALKGSSKLQIYPSPASNILFIKNTTSMVQTIYIFDIKGAEVLTLKVDGMEQSSIDIQNWKRGLYIMVSNTGERLKLMIE